MLILMFVPCRLGLDVLMQVDACRIFRFEDRLAPCHLVRGAVCHDQIAIRLDRLLVPDHAGLGDADAVERSAQRAEPAGQDRTLDGGDNHRRQVAILLGYCMPTTLMQRYYIRSFGWE